MRYLSASFLAVLIFVFICASCLWLCDGARRPGAIVAPVTRDSATLQYVVEIQQRTPLQKERVVIDITGDFLWVHCGGGSYNSSTFHPSPCRSAMCSAAGIDSGCGDCHGPPEPGCSNNTCSVFPRNAVAEFGAVSSLGQDVVALSSTDGKSPGPKVTIPRFAFSCTPGFLLEKLAHGVVGMAGLSRGPLALPTQLSAAFKFHRKFAICLPGGSEPGALFFGKEPYVFLGRGGIDISQRLSYTPLVDNRARFSNEYFIGVKAIQVGGKKVVVVEGDGDLGTKLSTVLPYTTFETSVYAAIRDAFVKEASAMNISRVPAVKPFDACFEASKVVSTRLGPSVPAIDLVLQKSDTIWRIFGVNSMVQVSDGVLCLAFLDGGEKPTTTIVIGSHQLQDNLLQFDLATSRLGFSSTLLFMQTTCSNFNFTSSA